MTKKNSLHSPQWISSLSPRDKPEEKVHDAPVWVEVAEENLSSLLFVCSFTVKKNKK